jgi:hypothetical protein
MTHIFRVISVVLCNIIQNKSVKNEKINFFLGNIKYAYKYAKINENRRNMHFFSKMNEICKIYIFNF